MDLRSINPTQPLDPGTAPVERVGERRRERRRGRDDRRQPAAEETEEYPEEEEQPNGPAKGRLDVLV